MTAVSQGGNTVREIYVYRLDQDFTEAQATWQKSATSPDTDWSGGTTVGAANNSATTQYSKSAEKKLVSKFNVGFRVTTEPDADITELVKDAVNRRSGTLLLWIGLPLSDTDTTSKASASIHSDNAVVTANRPKIDITVATRIVWDGAAGDGDISTATNWVGDVEPTTSDIAIFNDGLIDVTTGYFSCYTCFMSESYTGSIGTTSSSIRLLSDTSLLGGKFVFKKKRGLFNFDEYSDSGRGVYIANTSEDDTTFKNGAGAWNCFVHRTSGQFIAEGNSNLITGSDNNSKKVTTFGTQTEMVIGNNTKATLENGSLKSHIVNAKVKCKSGVLFNGADSFIAAESYVSQLGSSMGNVQILDGKLSFKDNENGSIESEDIYLWSNGIFDSRTTTGSWDTHADPSIIAKGGNFVVDVGRTLTIAN